MIRWGGAPRLIALLSVLGAASCKEEATPDAGVPDAAAEAAAPSVFEDPTTKVRFTWPSSWVREASARPTEPDGVSTLARLVRPKTATPVRPRLELTSEPTTLEDAELASRRVKNVLEAQLGSAGAKVRRATLSRRPVDGRFVGILDLAYAVPVEDREPTEVRHRSVIAHLALGEGSLAILTLTATYLARDHDLVGPEVDAIFESLALPPVARPIPGPSE